jgi:hypothetical protein
MLSIFVDRKVKKVEFIPEFCVTKFIAVMWATYFGIEKVIKWFSVDKGAKPVPKKLLVELE